MVERRSLLLVVLLGATTALAIVLGITDPTGTPGYAGRFLVWNLFLAWIPVVMALWFTRVRRTSAMLAVGGVWLAFLPNAPYLVTDLVHLSDGGEQLWRHVLQYGFAAWTGVMLGVASLRLVHLGVERRFGRGPGWAVVAGSTALCAIGVVIGRFQRWNSWDLITRPRAVASSTFDWVSSPVSDVRSSGVAVAVAAFFGLAYLTIWAFDGLRLAPAAEPDRS